MTPTPRRSRGLLVTALTLGLATALLSGAVGPAAAAPAADRPATRGSDPAHHGLYGAQDPAYDGVYRQGLSILALHASGSPVNRSAVRWLVRQQCTNGRWTSFRPDLTTRCGPGDSNATAMAVMALHAIGHRSAARAGMRWLRDSQRPGGGWEYSAGWGADANSTGLVLQAFLAMGRRPTRVTTGGASGFTFLRALQLDCTSAAPDRGALDYQPEATPAPNGFATAQAAQALARTSLPVVPSRTWVAARRPACVGGRLGMTTQDAAVGYLARVLRVNAGAIPAPSGTDPDLGSTANAVLSRVAAGTARPQVRAAMAVLESHARSFVVSRGRVLPGAAALVVLAEHATSGDPHDVDGLDLVRRIGGSITR